MSQSIGIIGGADGPTAIFVTGNPLPGLIGAAIVIGLIVLLIRYIHNKKK